MTTIFWHDKHLYADGAMVHQGQTFYGLSKIKKVLNPIHLKISVANIEVDDTIYGWVASGAIDASDAFMQELIRAAEHKDPAYMFGGTIMSYRWAANRACLVNRDNHFEAILIGGKANHSFDMRAGDFHYKCFKHEESWAMGSGRDTVRKFFRIHLDPIKAMLETFYLDDVSGGPIDIWSLDIPPEGVEGEALFSRVGIHPEIPKEMIPGYIQRQMEIPDRTFIPPMFIRRSTAFASFSEMMEKNLAKAVEEGKVGSELLSADDIRELSQKGINFSKTNPEQPLTKNEPAAQGAHHPEEVVLSGSPVDEVREAVQKLGGEVLSVNRIPMLKIRGFSAGTLIGLLKCHFVTEVEPDPERGEFRLRTAAGLISVAHDRHIYTDAYMLVLGQNETLTARDIATIEIANRQYAPLIIALDLAMFANQNVERLKDELAKYGAIAEDRGGNVPILRWLQTTGNGLDDLLWEVIYRTDPAWQKKNVRRPENFNPKFSDSTATIEPAVAEKPLVKKTPVAKKVAVKKPVAKKAASRTSRK